MLGCQFSHDFSSFRDLRWLFCYFHVPRARWVPHPTKFIPKQCSIQWASERYWFELSMRCKLWDICEKHTNIHTYIHTYIHDPSPFSIACWTSASRLRREASVWISSKRNDETLVFHWMCGEHQTNSEESYELWVRLKGLSHLVQSCFLCRSCMSKVSARSTGHVNHFFHNKILCSLQEINA